MEEFLRSVLEGFKEQSQLELAAVLFGVGYIALAAQEKVLCWYSAMIGNILFILVFLEADLYTKVGLRGYYLLMAFYGLYHWKKGGKGKKEEAPIGRFPLSGHLIAILSCSLLSIGIAYYLDRHSDAAMPYLDTSTTVFALITTWMVARKLLENWYYWIVIDGASIYLYSSKELYATTFLFILFTLMAFWGAYHWTRRYKQEQAMT